MSEVLLSLSKIELKEREPLKTMCSGINLLNSLNKKDLFLDCEAKS